MLRRTDLRAEDAAPGQHQKAFSPGLENAEDESLGTHLSRPEAKNVV
jgi:hypothetical protein